MHLCMLLRDREEEPEATEALNHVIDPLKLRLSINSVDISGCRPSKALYSVESIVKL